LCFSLVDELKVYRKLAKCSGSLSHKARRKRAVSAALPTERVSQRRLRVQFSNSVAIPPTAVGGWFKSDLQARAEN
jgi:hypothetical protein